MTMKMKSVITFTLLLATATSQLVEDVPVKYKLYKYDTKHYLFYSKTLANHKDAESICRANNGVLANIWSDALNQHLTNRMADLVSANWYAGKSITGSLEVHSYWTPYSITPSMWWQLGYSNWITKYSNIKQGGCAEVFLDESNNHDVFGYWNSINCLSLRPFICEIDEGETPIVVETISKKYMFFVERPLSYDDAQKVCQTYGGDLVMIQDETENSLVINAMKSAKSNYFFEYSFTFWVGAQVVNNKLLYANGQPLTYTNYTQSIQDFVEYADTNDYRVCISVYNSPGTGWGVAHMKNKLLFACEVAYNASIATNGTMSTNSTNSSSITNNTIALPDLSYLDGVFVQTNNTVNTTEHTITVVTNLTNNLVLPRQKLHRKITDVEITSSDLLWVIVSVGVLVILSCIILTALVVCTRRRS